MGRSPSVVGLATNSARGLFFLPKVPSLSALRYKENGPDQAPDVETCSQVMFDRLTIHSTEFPPTGKGFTTSPSLCHFQWGVQDCPPPLSGTRVFLQAAATLASRISDHFFFFTSTGTRRGERERRAKIRSRRAKSGKGNPGYAIHRVVEPEIDHIES